MKNKKVFRIAIVAVLLFALIFCFSGCRKKVQPDIGFPKTDQSTTNSTQSTNETEEPESNVNADTEDNDGQDETDALLVFEDEEYWTKDEVALYVYTFGHLPDNYISKTKAQKLGWEGGSLEPYAPGKSIGGSKFWNNEGILPEKEGRTYTECDIDTRGAGSRGAKRIVFSNDGLVFYTDDHYESFELLYGDP